MNARGAKPLPPGVRLAAALLVALTSALCAWAVAIFVDDMVVQPRTTLTGTVVETGTERVSAGRAAHDRLLIVVEGQPYVFFRQIGWFDTRQGMLDAVRTGRAATVRVLAQELRDEAPRAPAERRVHIIALEQDGASVFTEAALQGPRLLGLLVMALLTLVGAITAALLVWRPELLVRAKATPEPG